MKKLIILIAVILLVALLGWWFFFRAPVHVVKSSEDGGLMLEIPRDAMPDGVSPDDIRIEKLAPDKSYTVDDKPMATYKLIPDGLEFKMAVQFRMKFESDEAKIPTMFHISKGVAEIIPDLNVNIIREDENKYSISASAKISHFSELAQSVDEFFDLRTQFGARYYEIKKPIPFEFHVSQVDKIYILKDKEGHTAFAYRIKPGTKWSVNKVKEQVMFYDTRSILGPQTVLPPKDNIGPGEEYVVKNTIQCSTSGDAYYETLPEYVTINFTRQTESTANGTYFTQEHLYLSYKDHYVCSGNIYSPTPTPTPVVTGSPLPGPGASLGGKYYKVTSEDKAKDTGNEVCASVGKTCVGYTDLSLGSCLSFHPGANQSKDLNGSKAGFFCNGGPQGGICGKEVNTCHICPECNINMDCSMEIGILYRETYVECK